MISPSSGAARLLPARDEETRITVRGELQPTLGKAKQIIAAYHGAVNCAVTVRDRTGFITGEPSAGFQTEDHTSSPADTMSKICEFCRKYCDNPSRIWKGSDYPCINSQWKIPAETRRREKVYIYTCAAGFIFWSSPLYRNGRRAGTLTAGQVLSCKKTEVVEKFRALCRDRMSVGKFSRMLEKVPEKKPCEIEAMAWLLGICADEISEIKEIYPGEVKHLIDLPAYSGKKIKEAGEKTYSGARQIDSIYSSEKERMLLAAFRRGDKKTGNGILKELMDDIIAAVPGNFEIIRYRAVELTVMLSRATAQDGSGNRVQIEDSDRYLRRILESKTREELLDNLDIIAECMAGEIFSFRGVRHASALLKAERYIWENYAGKIRLEDIAKASGLSAPYFSSVFKEEMGENLSNYLNRLRVEKASVLLIETEKSLKKIAGLCGFEDQSWFSKIFKKNIGMSPGKYRESGGILCGCFSSFAQSAD